MSGFAGIVRKGGAFSAGSIVRAMGEALPSPSNTECAFWSGEDAALCHRPPYRTAEPNAVDLPLVSADGRLIVVFDGYLANYHELRSKLEAKGAHLRSGADAELVLHAFALWGRECPRKIDGEFAFAIWDADRRELFCARDHHGLRALFYHFDGAQFAFGSSVSSVLAVLDDDPCANIGFLAGIMTDRWYTADETVWQEVQRLPAAHSLHLSTGRIDLQRYWSLQTEVTVHYRCDEEYFEHYREMFADCVRRASRTNFPLAIEVSGGLDSSAVFVMADSLYQNGKLGAPDMRGYTLQGPAGDAADELHFVDAVARKTGRSIRAVPLFRPPLDWFSDQMRQLRDIPPYPNGAMEFDLNRQMLADGCRVKLTGVGGDQWLDGSRRYYHEALEHRDLAALLTSLRADLDDLGIAQTAPLLLRALIRPILPAALLKLAQLRERASRAEEIARGKSLSAEVSLELNKRMRAYMASLPDRDRDRYKIQKLAFPYNALGLDIAAQQYAKIGLEARNPMLSRQFIEFSASTPERLRLRGSCNKYIHRRALADLLPREVAERTSKGEFSVTYEHLIQPVCNWLENGQETSFGELLNEGNISGLVNVCRNATIDEAPYWELWGNYLVAQLFSQIER